jgi:hypothetical protein
MMAQAKHVLSDKPKPAGRPKQPLGWADIWPGAIVLTSDPPNHLDWYQCEVVASEAQEVFHLRWCSWPNMPPFTRRRVQLGLMHPACPPDLPPDLT